MASKARAPRGVISAAGRAADRLQGARVDFALIGGLAVAARGEPRFTRDVDFAVSVAGDEAAERLIHALSREGYRVETVVEHKRAGRLSTARLRPPFAAEIFIDLLFASSGIEPELAQGAEAIDYGGNQLLPVARTGHLIALKVLSETEARLQDRLDLEALARVATDEDWTLARESVQLIRERGFHRGRALSRRLRGWKDKLA